MQKLPTIHMKFYNFTNLILLHRIHIIILESKKLFVDGRMYICMYACMYARTYARTDGHLRPALLGRLGRLCRRVDLKTKARFGCLLRPPAWKWNVSILEEVNR